MPTPSPTVAEQLALPGTSTGAPSQAWVNLRELLAVLGGDERCALHTDDRQGAKLLRPDQVDFDRPFAVLLSRSFPTGERRFTTLALDFDAKPGADPERDCRVAEEILQEAGWENLVLSMNADSLSWHILATVPGGFRARDARQIARGMQERCPSFDPSPLLNIKTGSISLPFSVTKQGGRRVLLGAHPRALRALADGNTYDAIRRLIAALGGSLVGADRRDLARALRDGQGQFASRSEAAWSFLSRAVHTFGMNLPQLERYICSEEHIELELSQFLLEPRAGSTRLAYEYSRVKARPPQAHRRTLSMRDARIVHDLTLDWQDVSEHTERTDEAHRTVMLTLLEATQQFGRLTFTMSLSEMFIRSPYSTEHIRRMLKNLERDGAIQYSSRRWAVSTATITLLPSKRREGDVLTPLLPMLTPDERRSEIWANGAGACGHRNRQFTEAFVQHGVMNAESLAEMFNVRVSDIKRRHIPKLLEYGLIRAVRDGLYEAVRQDLQVLAARTGALMRVIRRRVRVLVEQRDERDRRMIANKKWRGPLHPHTLAPTSGAPPGAHLALAAP